MFPLSPTLLIYQWNIEMIREALSRAISEVANEVLPLAVGDIWRAENFMVLYRMLNFDSPTPSSDNWEGVATITGEIYVQVMTDHTSPVDPTPLIVALREQPIVIQPSESTPVGGYSAQLYWKPERIRDQMYTERIITQLEGELRNCYILKRLPDAQIIEPIDEYLP